MKVPIRRSYTHPERPWLLILLVGTLFACTVLMLLPRAPLMIAKMRWANRPFRDYRMAADVYSVSMHCHYDIAVERGQVTFIYQNWCDQLGWGYLQPMEPVTIEDLLATLTRETYLPTCGSGRCRCGSPMLLRVTWNRQLGYPETWQREPIAAGNRWLPPCAATFLADGGIWKITRVEPLTEQP